MSTPEKNPQTEPPDFSLVLGGPLYQLFRRARLAGESDSDAVAILKRRIVVIALFAWLPLLGLSLVEGHGWGGVAMPFLKDVDVHVRFLVALPLLVLAELVVHLRMRTIVRQFVERGLIPASARPQVDAALAAAARLRNSVVAEVILLALVYGVGVLIIWRTHAAVNVTSWYGVATETGRLQPSLAGWWFGCISLPLFQFILVRWYFRLFVWARFLWHVSRIKLKLITTHPDNCAGLSFLSDVSMAFAPLLLAQGALLAGTLANQIFYAGAKLPQFKMEIIGMVAAALFAVMGPLLVFVPMLVTARYRALREYGSLAQRGMREFEQEWLHGGGPTKVPLMPMFRTYDALKNMKAIPFTRLAFMQLTLLTLMPLVPLLLTMVSFENLVDRLLKVVF